MRSTLDTPMVECATTDAVCDVVREAVSTGVPLVDYGLAHEGLGFPPPAAHTRFKLTSHGIEHDPGDLSVRVDAGCTFGELGRTLAKANQFLPIDCDEDLSLGELIAHNVYGPLRLGYGGIGEMLLGLGFVDGEGRQVRLGQGETAPEAYQGRELTHLMVGSLGELGIITDATLRTSPMPAGTLSFDISMESAQTLDNFLPTWLTANARPTWLMMGRDSEHFTLHGAYFGHTAQCMTQLHSLETLIEPQRGLKITGTGEDRVDRDRIRRLTRARWQRNSPAVAKVVVPPATTGFLCATLAETPLHDPNRQIEAYPAHGCVFVGGPFDADDARRLDQQLSHVIQPIGGFALWYRRPGASDDIAPFSPRPDNDSTLNRLKAQMDPHGIFNPGRFLPPAEGKTSPV